MCDSFYKFNLMGAVLWIFEDVDREDIDRLEGVGSGEVDRGFVDGEDVDKVVVDSVQGKFAGYFLDILHV